MTKFRKFAPLAALAFALSPFAANAITVQGAPQHPGYVSGAAISQFAANSKGRATDHYAANSKGRATDHYAENSKGRPGENTQSAPETPFG